MSSYSLSNEEKRALSFLHLHGLHAEFLDTSTTGRCDILARDSRNRYLIEVKKRELSEEEQEGLKTEQLYQHPEKPIGYDENIKRILHNAHSQLVKTSNVYPSDFKLIWMDVTNTFDSYPDFERVMATVYGMEGIWIGKPVKCFYYKHSAFAKHRDIDGVIVVWNDKQLIRFVLLLNDLSERVEALTSSVLCQAFANGVDAWNPHQFEKDGHLYADCDINRNDKSAVVAYLKEKYGLSKFVDDFDLVSHSTTITLPLK